MTRSLTGPRSWLAGLSILIAMHSLSLAGPPLLCHPFDIGDQPSLPWGGEGWHNARPDYPTGKLVSDTLALLTPETPVIVRMETLRRAAIYSGKHSSIAQELLSRLKERAEISSAKGRLKALALFDAGYLMETYRQTQFVFKGPRLESTFDGYSWVVEAVGESGGDPQMEFAAAVITSDHAAKGRQREHLKAAVAGAAEGSLLARNLLTHFRHVGNTLAKLRASP